ncbi:hypothetical protein KJ359_002370 [Pestalotiopsis sp. 9143b]|nr:hypothetical protein KJ359_002370 [Pestalotiopsis sp. 9143b]
MVNVKDSFAVNLAGEFGRDNNPASSRVDRCGWWGRWDKLKLGSLGFDRCVRAKVLQAITIAPVQVTLAPAQPSRRGIDLVTTIYNITLTPINTSISTPLQDIKLHHKLLHQLRIVVVTLIASKMDLVSSIRKSGSRGGVNFSWDEVASSAHRENYLGHSLKAPVGRWQQGRDLEWYAKNKDADDDQSDETPEERAARERREEIKRVKEAEEDALARALGLPVKQRDQTGANSVEIARPRIGPQEVANSDAKQEDAPDRRRHKRHEDSDRRHRRRHRSHSRSRHHRSDRSPRRREDDGRRTRDERGSTSRRAPSEERGHDRRQPRRYNEDRRRDDHERRGNTSRERGHDRSYHSSRRDRSRSPRPEGPRREERRRPHSRERRRSRSTDDRRRGKNPLP